jgi:hypothetical protein
LEPATDSERQLFAQLAPERHCRHVAIIMDDHSRWDRVVFGMICRLAVWRELFIRYEANAVIVGLCRGLPRAEEATRSKQITAQNFENSSKPQVFDGTG